MNKTNPSIHTYIHTSCIHTYTYKHTYIHTCMHTYIHICTHTGLFATRDLAEGELITLVPSDAALIWDAKDRSPGFFICCSFFFDVVPFFCPFL